MFQAFWMGIPPCVSRRTAPGLEMWTTLNGPSHMGESLYSPSLESTYLESPGANVAAVISPQHLLVPCPP